MTRRTLLRPVSRPFAAGIAVIVCAAGAAVLATDSAAAPPDVLHATTSSTQACHGAQYPTSSAVDERRFTASVTGIVQARLTGQGDWDLAIFDGRTGTVVAASAGYATKELAEGFVTRGQALIVQACRFRGSADTSKLAVEFFAAPEPSDGGAAQLVTVATPNRAAKTSLQRLGLDLTEKATATSVDVVLHGKADVAKLRAAKFGYTVKIADLAKRSTANRAADRRAVAAGTKTALPTRRAAYRHLWDYELEMKRLSIAHPDFVRPLTLREPSLEGRPVEGIEITKNAQNLADGKPVYLQLGVHHAREWPSAEMPMEFAYDLLRSYGRDPAVAKRVDAVRTVIVPVVNPDGFNVSREAPSIGGDFSLFDYEYKRKNCRASDSPAAYSGGTCGANPGGAYRGTDPNRNYAGFWGGSGAGTDWSDETFRGSRPFSEPEVRNVRALVSSRQVAILITNHTYSGLVLRVPGVFDVRPPLEDKVYEQLGARIASHNGYANQRGYDLYDTTGDTEDWSYYATGGFGFTIELGTEEFHPPYADVVAEYRGEAPAPGAGKGGNRASYFDMLAAAADQNLHSTLQGTAPKGSVLRLRKTFTTPTSKVLDADGNEGKPLQITDTLDTSYVAPGGTFRFAANPSTRPYVAGKLGRDPVAPPQAGLTLRNPAGIPAENTGDPLTEGAVERIPFTIKGRPEVDNATADVSIKWGSTATDWDLYVLDSSGKLVAQSADANTNSETARLVDPKAGSYTAVVVNYENGADSDRTAGKVSFANPLPTTYGPTETWSLTCETAAGTQLGRKNVFVARGPWSGGGRRSGVQALTLRTRHRPRGT